MSLINDALKRARDAQPASPPSGAKPLPPVELPPRSGPGWILVTVAILLLVAACFLIGFALFGHKSATATAGAAPAVPMTLNAGPAPAPAPAASAAPTPVEVAVPPVTNVRPPAATTSNPPSVAAAVEQRLKLQGIIFNTGHPLAIVNGKTVNVGDRVGDYQVRQILRNSVILLCPDGSQKTLTLGE